MAFQSLFVGDAEFAVGRTGRKITESFVCVTVAESDPLHIAVELEVHDVVQNDLGAKPFGLGLDF